MRLAFDFMAPLLGVGLSSPIDESDDDASGRRVSEVDSVPVDAA